MQDEVRVRVDKEAELILDRIVEAIEMKLRDLSDMRTDIEKIAKAWDKLSSLGLENVPSILKGIRDDAQSGLVDLAAHGKTSSKKLDTIARKLLKLKQLDKKTKEHAQALGELKQSFEVDLQDIQSSGKKGLDILNAHSSTLESVANDVRSSKEVLNILRTSSEKKLKSIDKRESTLHEKQHEQSVVLTEIKDTIKDAEKSASALNKHIQGIQTKLEDSIEQRIAAVEQNLAGLAKDMQATHDSMDAVQEALGYLIQPWWKRLFGKGRP